jgi:DNA-binding transcriptional LysR family regulator
MPSRFELIFESPFILLRRKCDIADRALSGRLFDPPRIFVPVYNEEQDSVTCHPLAFAAAERLRPVEFRLLMDALAGARSREFPPGDKADYTAAKVTDDIVWDGSKQFIAAGDGVCLVDR